MNKDEQDAEFGRAMELYEQRIFNIVIPLLAFAGMLALFLAAYDWWMEW